MNAQRSGSKLAVRQDTKDTGTRAAKAKPAKGPPGTSSAASPPRHSVTLTKGARNEPEALYERFRSYDKGSDNGGDAIGPAGLQQLLSEAGVEANTLEMFVLLWRLGAVRQGCISRSEWLVAMYTYNIDQLTQLRLKLADWVEEVKGNREDAFTVMYNFLYDYIRGEQDRQMTTENAVGAWTVLFKHLDTAIVQSWLRWCTEEYHRPVSRDLWRQAWLYLSKTGSIESLLTAHDKSRWPTAIDDFVFWRRRQVSNVQ